MSKKGNCGKKRDGRLECNFLCGIENDGSKICWREKMVFSTVGLKVEFWRIEKIRI